MWGGRGGGGGGSLVVLGPGASRSHIRRATPSYCGVETTTCDEIIDLHFVLRNSKDPRFFIRESEFEHP